MDWRSITLALFGIVAPMLVAVAAGPPAEPATEPFRKGHRAIMEQLRGVDTLVGDLARMEPVGRRRAMESVVDFYDRHVVAHDAWEERALYPAIDRLAGGAPTLTSTLRYEHTIMLRWTRALSAEMNADAPDTERFIRRADNLSGLVRAHFEEEEQVLLPMLDGTMTSAEFRRDVMQERTLP